MFGEQVFGGAGESVCPCRFNRSYPQPLSPTATKLVDKDPAVGRVATTQTAGGGVCTGRPAHAPPIVESSAGGPCTPAQNIFAKVKAVIWPLTCGYSNIDDGLSTKVGNKSEILPYI